MQESEPIKMQHRHCIKDCCLLVGWSAHTKKGYTERFIWVCTLSGCCQPEARQLVLAGAAGCWDKLRMRMLLKYAKTSHVWCLSWEGACSLRHDASTSVGACMTDASVEQPCMSCQHKMLTWGHCLSNMLYHNMHPTDAYRPYLAPRLCLPQWSIINSSRKELVMQRDKAVINDCYHVIDKAATFLSQVMLWVSEHPTRCALLFFNSPTHTCMCTCAALSSC